MPKRKKVEDESSQQETKPSKQAKLKLDGSLISKDHPSSTPEVQSFRIPSKDKEIQCERRDKNGKPSLIFTHGAGGGLSNAATRDFAEGFSEVLAAVSFQGNMNLQGRVRSFQTVLEHEDVQCALGGRSMGARGAVLAAQQSNNAITSLILVSYPMIGAQKGDSREQILLDLPESVDVVFISGTNDSMCDMTHLHRVMKEMKARSWLVEVQGADHGMSLKQKAGTQPMVKHTGVLAAEWLLGRDEANRYSSLSWSGGECKVISTGWQSEPKSTK